ncbi:MAG TPA: 4'-phosphopantetheinyl transferase superfamily protein [Thermoanaerobaculia bacterium]|nr:4'-phosphopantetheinyl transferase superfamily protein [Thermoanaerobaculia bacterium]
MTAPVLREGEVHLWWWGPAAAAALDSRAEYLDAGERARASSFRFERHRRSWTAGRAALRSLAGRYLDLPPREIRFECGFAGKPRIPDASLHFSVSRSDGAILVAFAGDREIGADVERLRPQRDGTNVAGKFFAPAEAASLAALPEGIRSEAFFRCWTAKEAYLKGRGDGLGFPLDAFEVSLEGDGPRRLVAHREAAELDRWWLVPFTPDEGYVAAVAAAGERPVLRRFEGERS